MKKVLIITYYWPPMGGGGVHRWLKFTKYLRSYNWEPVIYTPLNADVANADSSLKKDVPENIVVHRKEIWEPFDLYKKFTGKSKDEKVQPGFLQESDANQFLQKIAVWIRGNLFIPDAKKFWINPSVKYLTEIIQNDKIDAIISTGPPHSNHLIAMKVKKKTGVKWLADFRDPWTNIDYYDKLLLSKWANNKHKKLEKKVLKEADEVVTVSWSWAEDFNRLTGRKPKVVTNGYDEEDFILRKSVKNEFLTLTHIGSLNSDRNPFSFWEALKMLIYEKNGKIDLQIKLIGPTDVSVFNSIKALGLQNFTLHIPNLPHKKVIHEIVNSDILILPLNDTPNIDGVIPGKLYEYMASKRPILCIGKPDGDSAKIILESKLGHVFDFKDVSGILSFLKNAYSEFEMTGEIKENQVIPEKFSRKNLAGQISTLLEKMISHSDED